MPGRHEQTRTDHLRTVMSYLGWRSAEESSLKELDEFPPARSMEHDSPTLLFRLACEHLITARPPAHPVASRGAGRAAAGGGSRNRHDRPRWLGTGPTDASAAAVKTEVGKLAFLRCLDAHTPAEEILPVLADPTIPMSRSAGCCGSGSG